MKNTILFISFLYLIFLSGFIFSIQAQEVSGFVFDDSNNNGVFDEAESGVANVLVSNQNDVTISDENGKYEITSSEETVIFITKPNGYKVPLNRLNIPQFYYIHQPGGSPEQKYKGIDPTGNLPSSLDFPLHKYTEKDSFSVVLFADPQPRSLEEIHYIRDDVVAELVGYPAAFGVALGDVMFDDLSLYDAYKEVIAKIGFPFYYVAGNHDINFDSSDDTHALETFKSHFGPPYYSFDYGKVHFVVLDDVEWKNEGEEEAHYIGKIGEKQLRWLENDIQYVPGEYLVVLMMHIPLNALISEHEAINVKDCDELFQILKNRDHVLALAGHMHIMEHQYLTSDIGWQGKNPFHHITLATVSGTWWNGPEDERGIPIADQRDGVPNGYHIMTFNGNRYTEQFKAAGKDASYQLRITFPNGTLNREQLSDSLIIVNVFNGGEKSVVEYRIDNGEYKSLERQIRTDPYFVSLLSTHKDKYPDWIESHISNHIWTGNFPDGLEPGVHSLEVRTVDQYGKIYRSVTIFEVSN